MPYESAEVRWFSKEREKLWKIYTELKEPGEGTKESPRTDYYLRSGTENTGIKYREGRHEWKLKYKPDERMEYGIIQHWKKWSTREDHHILNSIEQEMLDDWIPVRKQRYKKQYELSGEHPIQASRSLTANNGCDLEYTEIMLPSKHSKMYTLGLEAFGDTQHFNKLLHRVLDQLEADRAVLRACESKGYTEWLKSVYEQDSES